MFPGLCKLFLIQLKFSKNLLWRVLVRLKNRSFSSDFRLRIHFLRLTTRLTSRKSSLQILRQFLRRFQIAPGMTDVSKHSQSRTSSSLSQLTTFSTRTQCRTFFLWKLMSCKAQQLGFSEFQKLCKMRNQSRRKPTHLNLMKNKKMYRIRSVMMKQRTSPKITLRPFFLLSWKTLNRCRKSSLNSIHRTMKSLAVSLVTSGKKKRSNNTLLKDWRACGWMKEMERRWELSHHISWGKDVWDTSLSQRLRRRWRTSSTVTSSSRHSRIRLGLLILSEDWSSDYPPYILICYLSYRKICSSIFDSS